MDKRIVGLVGLVAGVLAVVGLFSPWVTVSGWGLSGGISVWDLILNADVALDRFGLAELFKMGGWAFLALGGAVLLVVGSLCALVAPRIKLLWAIPTLGAILALVGAVWALSDVDTGRILGFTASYGYGLYLTLSGGILGLSSVLSLIGWPVDPGG